MTQPLHADITRRSFVTGLAVTLATAATSASGLAAQSTGPYTFLGLGLDRYTAETGQRSDIIMLARVDMEAETVRVLSIPRDLYVEIPGYAPFKINDAYNRGIESTPQPDWRNGARVAAETITHNFGIELDGVALTDFEVFPQVIDAIGGVTVMNPYDVAGGNYTFPSGELTLDGEAATYFSRLRPDGDGGRVMRQHLVLEAMLERLKSPELLPRIPELVETLSDVVETTIPVEIQAQLIALIPRLSSESLAFTNIEDMLWSGYTSGGAWIYEGDWAVLPGYVESWLAGDIE